MALLSGYDTWTDLPRIFGIHLTQPDKLRLNEESRDPQLWHEHILPLLSTMETAFRQSALDMSELLRAALATVTNNADADDTDGNGRCDSGDVAAGTATDGISASSSTDQKTAQGQPPPLRTQIIESVPLSADALHILREMDDVITLFYLRVRHVNLLYKSRTLMTPADAVNGDDAAVSGGGALPITAVAATAGQKSAGMSGEYVMQPITVDAYVRMRRLQSEARNVLIAAQRIIHNRESHYRTPFARISAWTDEHQSTVYRHMYLWPAHSLYYWWREQGIAEAGFLPHELQRLIVKFENGDGSDSAVSSPSPLLSLVQSWPQFSHSFNATSSPCYLNRIDASEVAVGRLKYALEVLRVLTNVVDPHTFVNCFTPPLREYEFPRDL